VVSPQQCKEFRPDAVETGGSPAREVSKGQLIRGGSGDNRRPSPPIDSQGSLPLAPRQVVMASPQLFTGLTNFLEAGSSAKSELMERLAHSWNLALQPPPTCHE